MIKEYNDRINTNLNWYESFCAKSHNIFWFPSFEILILRIIPNTLRGLPWRFHQQWLFPMDLKLVVQTILINDTFFAFHGVLNALNVESWQHTMKTGSLTSHVNIPTVWSSYINVGLNDVIDTTSLFVSILFLYIIILYIIFFPVY